MTQRYCCDKKCMRRDLADQIGPRESIIDRISATATEAARTCPDLTLEQQRQCASRLFDIAAECELADAFALAYQRERYALLAKNQKH